MVVRAEGAPNRRELNSMLLETAAMCFVSAWASLFFNSTPMNEDAAGTPDITSEVHMNESTQAGHERLLKSHLRRAGLDKHIESQVLLDHAEARIQTKESAEELKSRLLASGEWIEDPLPRFRKKAKPWVLWSVREKRIGPALHLEYTRWGLNVHIDVFNPGKWPMLYPAHVMVDLWGWKSLRVAVLDYLADRLPQS
jgi:hypothetical protein